MECTYDPGSGNWRFHTFRPDKSTPNFIRVVFDTLLVIAEGVTAKVQVVQKTFGSNSHRNSSGSSRHILKDQNYHHNTRANPTAITNNNSNDLRILAHNNPGLLASLPLHKPGRQDRQNKAANNLIRKTSSWS